MNEAWIEQSLARLESLETQQAQFEAAGQAPPPALVDEIQALYETLDAAAGDDDPAPAPAPVAVPAVAPTPFGASSAAATPIAAPTALDAPAAFGAPAPAAAPFAQGGAPMMQSTMSASDYDDFDDTPGKSKAPIFAVVAVAVIGLGVGGWYMNAGAKAPPPAAPTGEAKVISASAVPEDTQEPQVAKGADATQTLGTKYKEGAPQPSRSNNNRSNNNRSRSRPRNNKRKKKDDSRKIKVDNKRDPLAGVD